MVVGKEVVVLLAFFPDRSPIVGDRFHSSLVSEGGLGKRIPLSATAANGKVSEVHIAKNIIIVRFFICPIFIIIVIGHKSDGASCPSNGAPNVKESPLGR